MKKTFSPRICIQFRQRVLAWYRSNARDLPWRADHDPYRVWISEIMLQQTRVAAVMEHYHAFLKRFPTLQKLAAAREACVLAIWSGLGYYRRARMLHAAARVIVREHGGKFPTSAERLRELPGIGRYTSAAIASIAFDQPVAVVDGNVERVMQRVAGSRLGGEELWKAANDLLDEHYPGDFNQAMMELGAVICTPRAPACLTCPVVALCATRGELPGVVKVAPQAKREIHYALNSRDGEVFLVQRSGDVSLMASMWELPEIQSLNDGHAPLLTLRHSITVTDYTVKVWESVSPIRVKGEWFRIDRLARLPLTGLARKILLRAEIIAPERFAG